MQIRRLTPLPPMHAFATPIIPASIRQGAPTYIMRRYEHSSFVRAIERHRITETFLAPPSVIGIPKCHLVTKEALATIRQIWFGGAAVSHENRLPLQRLLHEDARISASWGMTEAGWVTPTCYPEVQTSGSVGSPLEGYTVR
jgi:acyl-coenzyme A synthetase/AMP-(fatty) acid ligase